MVLNLLARLAALEAAKTAMPVLFTPEETAEAARRYEASLHDQEEPDPRAQAYWATATLHQLASNYNVMLKGDPALWV